MPLRKVRAGDARINAEVAPAMQGNAGSRLAARAAAASGADGVGVLSAAGANQGASGVGVFDAAVDSVVDGDVSGGFDSSLGDLSDLDGGASARGAMSDGGFVWDERR